MYKTGRQPSFHDFAIQTQSGPPCTTRSRHAYYHKSTLICCTHLQSWQGDNVKSTPPAATVSHEILLTSPIHSLVEVINWDPYKTHDRSYKGLCCILFCCKCRSSTWAESRKFYTWLLDTKICFLYFLMHSALISKLFSHFQKDCNRLLPHVTVNQVNLQPITCYITICRTAHTKKKAEQRKGTSNSPCVKMTLNLCMYSSHNLHILFKLSNGENLLLPFTYKLPPQLKEDSILIIISGYSGQIFNHDGATLLKGTLGLLYDYNTCGRQAFG